LVAPAAAHVCPAHKSARALDAILRFGAPSAFFGRWVCRGAYHTCYHPACYIFTSSACVPVFGTTHMVGFCCGGLPHLPAPSSEHPAFVPVLFLPTCLLYIYLYLPLPLPPQPSAFSTSLKGRGWAGRRWFPTMHQTVARNVSLVVALSSGFHAQAHAFPAHICSFGRALCTLLPSRHRTAVVQNRARG